MKIFKPASETDDREETFSYLPPEIILNILSRVPIKTVFTCKCVCKSWLELLESTEFARSHLSNSDPGLLIYIPRYIDVIMTSIFKIFEFEDSSPSVEWHELRYKTVLELNMVDIFNLDYGSVTQVEGSDGGLLLLRNITGRPSNHYVCNPITREYIKLPLPELMSGLYPQVVSCGFGVSRLSNQYKVVRIFYNSVCDPGTGLSARKLVCQVYTLGTVSWRGITVTCEMRLFYHRYTFSKLLNGNLHWLTSDSTGTCGISCLDLETEVFTEFQAPKVEPRISVMSIGVLRDRLCFCDNSSESEISIYMLNDYEDEKKSWSKEYVISRGTDPEFAASECTVCAVKAFGDGDLLLAQTNTYCFCYSNRTKTVALFDILDADVSFVSSFQAVLHTPSFITLKDYETENSKVCELVISVS